MDDDGTAPCFEPVRRVAQSYLGTLWIAADKRAGDTGAVALLRRVRLPRDTPPEVREAITRAAAAARGLRHENILSVLDVLEDGAELGIAYEHVDAEPLRVLQSSAEVRGLAFPIGVSLRIGIDLLMGLESLHQAHRTTKTPSPFGGLSPDSVLISKKGEAKLLDALVASCAASFEAIGSHVEKLGYVAPEQVRPSAPLTAESDVFAVGALLWELLTGRRLLVGTRAMIERKLLDHDLPSVSAALREGQTVSPALAAIIDAALAADPSERPASARALASQLQRCGHPVASRDALAQLVAELSAPQPERRAAEAPAAEAPAPPPTVPQPQPASASSARNIRLPMPARARSRAERLPSPVPPTVAAPRATPTLPGLPKAAPDAPATPPRQAAPREPARIEPPVPAPRPPPVRGAGRTLARPPRSKPLLEAAAPISREPVPPVSVASPEAVVLPPGAPPALELPELDAPFELEASELDAPFEVEASELDAPFEVEGSELEAPELPPLLAELSRRERAAASLPAPPMLAAPELASRVEEPVSSAPRHAFSFPPMPGALPGTAMGVVSSGARPASARMPLRRKLSFGVLGAALLVGVTFAASSALKALPSVADASPSAALPALTTEAPPTLETVPAHAAPVQAAPAHAAPAHAAPVQDVTPQVAPNPAAVAEAPEPPAGSTAEHASAPPASGSQRLPVEPLSDGQLVAAFALEQRRDVPACSERLAAGSTFTGDQPQPSRAHFNAARRALLRGQLDVAYTELCLATAYDLGNLAAQRNLAELALDLGDPARAREAAERGLVRAPNSAELLGVLGDALALLGELPESRRRWLETLDSEGSETERRQSLAASYLRAGERALTSFDVSRARSYFRRALLLTDGAHEASLGLADALLRLGQTAAALAWAERAASGLPASARAQLLLGDAHEKRGELDRAREAWLAARRIEPGNGIVARRLSRSSR